MKLFCLLLMIFSVSAAMAGEKRLTREQFNLVAESANELDEIVARIESIRDRLRSVNKDHEPAPATKVVPAEQPLVPVPLDEAELPAPPVPPEDVFEPGSWPAWPLPIPRKKVEPAPIKSVVKMKGKTLLLITSPAWCEPCQWVEKKVLPRLRKDGWIIREYGSGGTAHLWTVNRDAQGDVAAKFNGETDVIPLWILVVDDVVTRRKEGAMTAEEVLAFQKNGPQ